MWIRLCDGFLNLAVVAAVRFLPHDHDDTGHSAEPVAEVDFAVSGEVRRYRGPDVATLREALSGLAANGPFQTI